MSECGKGENPSNEEIIKNMGKTARDACNKISSRAEEIKAQGEADGNILANIPFFSLFNPNNYKAGDNTNENIMRNIINTDMSQCDVTKIYNDCNLSTIGSQKNIISNRDCPVLELAKLGIFPEFKNITQENAMNIQQQCVMNTVIDTLLKKKSSVDSQALSEVFQEASGLLSGSNKFQKEDCNVINNNLSSIHYLEDRAKCAVGVSNEQLNNLDICGSAVGVFQKNRFESTQDCLKGVDIAKETDVDASTKTKSEDKSDQRSVGVDTMASIISSILIALVLLSIFYIKFKILFK